MYVTCHMACEKHRHVLEHADIGAVDPNSAALAGNPCRNNPSPSCAATTAAWQPLQYSQQQAPELLHFVFQGSQLCAGRMASAALALCIHAALACSKQKPLHQVSETAQVSTTVHLSIRAPHLHLALAAATSAHPAGGAGKPAGLPPPLDRCRRLHRGKLRAESRASAQTAAPLQAPTRQLTVFPKSPGGPPRRPGGGAVCGLPAEHEGPAVHGASVVPPQQRTRQLLCRQRPRGGAQKRRCCRKPGAGRALLEAAATAASQQVAARLAERATG